MGVAELEPIFKMVFLAKLSKDDTNFALPFVQFLHRLIQKSTSSFKDWLIGLVLFRSTTTLSSIYKNIEDGPCSFQDVVDQDLVMSFLPPVLLQLASMDSPGENLVKQLESFVEVAFPIFLNYEKVSKGDVDVMDGEQKINLPQILAHLVGQLACGFIRDDFQGRWSTSPEGEVKSISASELTMTTLESVVFQSGFPPSILQAAVSTEASDQLINDLIQLSQQNQRLHGDFLLSLIEGEGEGKQLMDNLNQAEIESSTTAFIDDPSVLKLQRTYLACVIRHINRVEECRKFAVPQEDSVQVRVPGEWMKVILRKSRKLKERAKATKDASESAKKVQAQKVEEKKPEEETAKEENEEFQVEEKVEEEKEEGKKEEKKEEERGEEERGEEKAKQKSQEESQEEEKDVTGEVYEKIVTPLLKKALFLWLLAPAVQMAPEGSLPKDSERGKHPFQIGQVRSTSLDREKTNVAEVIADEVLSFLRKDVDLLEVIRIVQQRSTVVSQKVFNFWLCFSLFVSPFFFLISYFVL